jgi:hypothetical protein
MNRLIDTRRPWCRQESRHGKVAAHGVTTGPTLVPISRASNWSWLSGGAIASPAVYAADC